MRTVQQLEQEVEWAQDDHTAALGRLLAAEAKHDRAKTAWGRDRAARKVLSLIEDARATENVYRGLRLDLALRRWEQAAEDARAAEGKARRAVNLGKAPETINKAIEARDNAVDAIAKAALEVERWKPVA